MKQFDLHTGESKLQSAFEALQLRWQETADHWRDDVSHQFAQNHLDPLSPLLKNAVNAIGRMAAVVDRAERECGDERDSGLR